MKKINAEIVADSIDKRGNRITSFILTYPRFIHSELMTHRMFSRNSASSRAIPFEKMLQMVNDDPFIPIAWQKGHSGMQGTEYFTNKSYLEVLNRNWLYARDFAIQQAQILTTHGATKQVTNRLLEPFMWHTVLVTATEFENFFELRCPKYKIEGLVCIANSKKQWKELKSWSSAINETPANFYEWQNINTSPAEIHIQALAESMFDVYNESKPQLLQDYQWHIPFGDQIDDQLFSQTLTEHFPNWYNHEISFTENISREKCKIAVSRAARLSYTTHDGEINYLKDLLLHDQLFQNKHLSCFEHTAKCMTDAEYNIFTKGALTYNSDADLIYDDNIHGWCNNFKGFIPYRYIIENNGKI